MVLVIDRHFVHRLRMVIGKDGNPPLMNNNRVMVGDAIRLTADDLERPAEAFFTEIGRKFL